MLDWCRVKALLDVEPGDVKLLAASVRLEDALGLTAKGQAQLRWRVVDEAAVPVEAPPVDGRKARLRVVDAQAG